MIGISYIPSFYGTIAMTTRPTLDNFFVLYRIEFIFGMEVSWDNRHHPHTSLL